MGGLVGQYGVYVPVAETRLVKTYVCAQILRIQNIFFGVGKLIPTAVIADFLLVLFA